MLLRMRAQSPGWHPGALLLARLTGEAGSAMTDSIKAVAELIADWQGARAALAEIERAGHPDITDRFGRVWTWKANDLYRHCGNAAPAYMIDDFGLPTQRSLDNPNSDPCDICLDGRSRNVRKCRPEWKCSHKACQSPNGGV